MNESRCKFIEILNLFDGETISHPILLIKGRLTLDSRHQHEIKLLIAREEANENKTLETIVTKSIVTGEFKFLVDFREITKDLLLELNFYCCDLTRTIIINYKIQSGITGYQLQPLLLVCQGERTDNSDAICQLIDLNLLLVQCLYAEKLREHGFGRLTFTLNGKCNIFQSRVSCQQAWDSSEDELWNAFGREILNSPMGGDAKLKFVAFISCTRYDGDVVSRSGDYSYVNIKKNIKAHAALGGGGLALFGSAYFYAWPRCFEQILSCLKNETKVDLAYFPDDSNYRRTYAGVYGTSLGSVCHEIGHIFDLGHTEDGIMGSGLDYLNGVFTLDTLTVDLPKRSIQKGVMGDVTHPRFTQLKKKTHTFLNKYHEQRGAGDSFYFTRNCAVILAHHRWIRKDFVFGQSVEPTFDTNTRSVIAGIADPIKLIEIRCKSNGLVKYFFEISPGVSDEPVYNFMLPASAIALLNTHNIFVITASGYTKSLSP